MYLINKTRPFEKSLKKLEKSGKGSSFLKDLDFIVNSLARGNNLPTSCNDHQLNGEFKDFRECHIKNDLLLVYKIEKNKLILILVNIGSHSQIFG